MSDQQIIDAIEAEVKATQELSSKVRLTSTGAAETILGHMAYINGLRFAIDLLNKRNEASINVPTWEQTAKDCEQILCQSGDLFRECYNKLLYLGETETASKVLAFCKRAHTCMSSGKKWEETDRVDL